MQKSAAFKKLFSTVGKLTAQNALLWPSDDSVAHTRTSITQLTRLSLPGSSFKVIGQYCFLSDCLSVKICDNVAEMSSLCSWLLSPGGGVKNVRPSVGAILAGPVAGPSGSCRKDRSYNKHRAHAVL